MFDQRAVFVCERAGKTEDQLTEVALEAGADDVEIEDDVAVFYADAKEFIDVKAALEAADMTFLSAELAYVPQNRIAVEDEDTAKKVLKLIDALEDLDDVQNVYANYDIPSEWM